MCFYVSSFFLSLKDTAISVLLSYCILLYMYVFHGPCCLNEIIPAEEVYVFTFVGLFVCLSINKKITLQVVERFS